MRGRPKAYGFGVGRLVRLRHGSSFNQSAPAIFHPRHQSQDKAAKFRKGNDGLLAVKHDHKAVARDAPCRYWGSIFHLDLSGPKPSEQGRQPYEM